MLPNKDQKVQNRNRNRNVGKGSTVYVKPLSYNGGIEPTKGNKEMFIERRHVIICLVLIT